MIVQFPMNRRRCTLLLALHLICKLVNGRLFNFEDNRQLINKIQNSNVFTTEAKILFKAEPYIVISEHLHFQKFKNAMSSSFTFSAVLRFSGYLAQLSSPFSIMVPPLLCFRRPHRLSRHTPGGIL